MALKFKSKRQVQDWIGPFAFMTAGGKHNELINCLADRDVCWRNENTCETVSGLRAPVGKLWDRGHIVRQQDSLFSIRPFQQFGIRGTAQPDALNRDNIQA